METQDTTGNSGRRFVIIFSISLLIIAILLLLVDHFWETSGLEELGIKFAYIALALIGVLFHLVSRFRTLRDEGEGFDWRRYWFDYLFRAFQAVVYVIIISNLIDKQATNEIALISLFTGMFIRRVEEAFESLGDRFGDMLRGMLGAYVQRISPIEQQRQLKELNKQFINLRKSYQSIKANLPKKDADELEKRLAKIKEHILKRRIDAAERDLLGLEFQIDDLKLEIKKGK